VTIVATPEVGTELSPPRIRLDFDAGGGHTFTSLTVSRDGRPLARSIPPVGVQQTFAYDYEAPYGRPVTYMATGETSDGPYSEAVTIQFDEPGVWLIHPTTPGLSLRIDSPDKAGIFVLSGTRRDVTRPASRVVFSPPGRDRSVVYPMGPRALPDWTLELATPTLELRDSLVSLLSDNATLLLRVPFGYGDGSRDVPDGWYSVGDETENRPGASDWRVSILPLTPTAEPPVRLAPVFTWGDLVLSYTWGHLLPHTWLDVLAGEV